MLSINQSQARDWLEQIEMSSLLILEKNDQVPKTVINVKSEHMFLYHGVELLNQN